MHSFDVSDVPVEQVRLRSASAKESLAARLGRPIEAMASGLPIVGESTNHPFVDAVSVAFRRHLPLAISPDDVWLCLVQAVGIHVNLNAEALRGQIVQHSGKQKIVVTRDEFRRRSPENDWAGVFTEFAGEIDARTSEFGRRFIADFSTTGAVERAASQIALMAAVEPYFDYWLRTLCGIPRITLLGSTDDWRAIRQRAEGFAALGLEKWMSALLPVLDAFVLAASGNVDREFWRSFFKWEDRSGGAAVTGWINVLFPYLETAEVTDKREIVTRPRPNAWSIDWDRPPSHRGDGPSEHRFGSGLASAPLAWEYFGQMIPLDVLGGFFGLSQDPESLAVRPAIGWVVCESA